MSDPTVPPPDQPIPSSPPRAAIPPTEYEFTPEQDQVIDALADGIRWVRVPLVVVAAFQLVIAVAIAVEVQTAWMPRALSVIMHVFAAIFFFVLAAWLQRAAASFDRVTHTKGRDVTNVLLGIRSLALWFGTLGWIVKVYLILLALMIVALVIRMLGGGAAGA
jgi:hypothetical protein